MTFWSGRRTSATSAASTLGSMETSRSADHTCMVDCGVPIALRQAASMMLGLVLDART